VRYSENRTLNGGVREFEDMGAHQYRSLGSGHWSVPRAMGGFDDVDRHVHAGSFSRDRRSAEPKYCTRHDRADAGCAVVDGSHSAHVFQRATKELLSDLDWFTLFLVALLVTILVEVPVVKQIVTWTVSTLPGNWQQLRDRWQAFPVIRVVASVAGLVLLLIGAIF
jgi:hypothetical protein